MKNIKTDKHKYFKYIVSKRVNRILEQLRLIKNCANKNNYAYTDEDLDKIFEKLRTQTLETEQLLRNTLNTKKSTRFTLK